MSLDFPASGVALWSIFDAGGPRPEFVLPVLWSESGFNPSITNSIGCQGVNQNCSPPPGYNTWSASQQIAGSVKPYMLSYVQKYGPLRSGTRVYVANFLPCTLPKATDLSYVLAVRGSSAPVCPGFQLSQAAVYNANPGLDYQKTGAIRVSDMAHFIAKAAGSSAVKNAIAQTYALRPSETPQDPVYGTDFGYGATPAGGIPPWLLIAGVGVVAGLAAYLAVPPARRRV